ncbi:GNAT family N-acetyltransferase [Cryobacterium sp. PH31-AA6]|uniref:GNAT family N-acetyltransferase n=1 Tax=Cryobacterium sp. PH31-AA6 TaxID=3046205 RepID=UPI0024BBD8E8|nr:GNAT family N-acetyltransferase [Cryobacterium sp. PH31-AA6]MDJ0323451.1 GNAT family N-acetyltransferase [Cryobacterium sp. PH31-AA6]
MKIARVRLTDPEVAPLLTDLGREYEERYGGGGADTVHDVEAGAFDPPTGGFIVLLDGANTVAGGGIRQLDERTCEVKRMWTNPAYRRAGHASTVLTALEELARELGYRMVRLETGYAQPEALAMYRRLGYREIGNYGIYDRATGFERTIPVDDDAS